VVEDIFVVARSDVLEGFEVLGFFFTKEGEDEFVGFYVLLEFFARDFVAGRA